MAQQPPATQEASKAQQPPQPEQQAMSNGAAVAGLPEAATGGEPAAKAQVAEAPRPRNGRVVIQPGNNLWNISRVIYGKGTRYTVIYRANKGLIRSPRLIYPGQIFATPGSVAPVSIDPSWRKPLAEIVGDGKTN
jgi:nucleoid-associated protein YgaU